MKCIKCYQEISEGVRFCPYCGADQTAMPEAGDVNVQPEEAAQTGIPIQETGTQYQESYSGENQSTYSYGNGSQNNTYQSTPSYQQDQGDTVNWVPYLVLSIISTICCCIPFGIAAIVFSAKINSAVTAGNMEEARKAAKSAKIWIIVAVVAGLIGAIGYVAITTLIGAGTTYYYY